MACPMSGLAGPCREPAKPQDAFERMKGLEGVSETTASNRLVQQADTVWVMPP